jgi:hypothetical protein
MSAASFSPNTPNKIGKEIRVSGKNTLVRTGNGWRAAIADGPIDAKVDGKRTFCVRVENAGSNSYMMIGVTPLETFDSNAFPSFGSKDFTGCGLGLFNGNLYFPVSEDHKIDKEFCKNAKEIVIILTISNNGAKKYIRFLCDGNESKSTDVSEYLRGDRLFPALCMMEPNQRVTTFPIDQIKTRTPEIENLIKEYRQQQKEREAKAERERYTLNVLRQVLELRRVFLQQAEIQRRAVMAKMKFEMKM